MIGSIFVGRRVPGALPAPKVELLNTFADQAVIAIENARLFNDLEARNRDIVEALEDQTLTGEILRVISRSPDSVQPVFDTIAEHAMKLCGAQVSVVSRVDGGRLQLASLSGVSREARESIARNPHEPMRRRPARAPCARRSSTAPTCSRMRGPA